MYGAVHRLLRYITVGMVSNGLLYVLYLLAVRIGTLPEIASSLAFAAGVAGTYIVNRAWSFKSDAAHHDAAPRYVLAYGAGYSVQIAVLSLGYRLAAIPHEFAQLAAMVAAAGTIFLLLNFWVFRSRRD